ncbi:MAG: Rpn family recombination-promoting nuclease/putative transposase [Prevotellaceae bacterium]|jgi:predicted transposase/invertase (TIGR01784 family)|nr:Rpn family recombination-promoting nuclease/putative transposase [Prevotellaceae bacterium]
MAATQEKYINPFTDFGFKKLFGSEVNKDLLLDFLNTLIEEQGEIVDIQYQSTEHLGRTESDRKAVFDIYCQNDKGEKFIVEMQKAKQNYFKDRSVYYSTFPIQEQVKRGDWDYKLTAIYMIGILDFCFNESEEEKVCYRHDIKLMDMESKKVFYDKLTFIYLEMPKFNKTESELATQFDKWLYVLKNLPLLTSRPTRLQERVFEHVFTTAEIAKFTPTEQMAYDESLKNYRDLKNVIDTAVQEAKAEGKAEGIIEGKAEGIIEGKEEGIIEGIAIGERKGIEKVVLKAHKANVSIEQIQVMTGLTKEEIIKILLDNS